MGARQSSASRPPLLSFRCEMLLAPVVVACYAIAERTVARILSIAVFRFSSALRVQ